MIEIVVYFFYFNEFLNRGNFIFRVVTIRTLLEAVADSTLRDVWNSIQQNHIPPTILTNWAKEAFPTKMEYLAFKSRFIYSMATQSIVSHAYGFNQVHPSKWLLDRETGAIQVHGQKMDNLRANQWTPSLRLTPNLLNFAQICGSKHALVEAVQDWLRNHLTSYFT